MLSVILELILREFVRRKIPLLLVTKALWTGVGILSACGGRSS